MYRDALCCSCSATAVGEQMCGQEADLGVIDAEACVVPKQALANIKSRSLSGIASVLLECKA